ncbi:MAG: calcium channel protein [Sporothrix thermara]
MERKHAARMTAIPQLGIPDILVDAEDDTAAGAGATGGQSVSAAPVQAGSAFLSAENADGPSQHHRSWSGASMDISLHDTSYAHPLSAPRTSGLSTPTASGGLQPHRHHLSSSALSFELQEPGAQLWADESRRGSAVSAMSSGVSPGLVREMLDESVWVESIRRSATQRRSGWRL